MANINVRGIDLSTGQRRYFASTDRKTFSTGVPDDVNPTYDAKTSDYTILTTDNEKVFTNTGASGTITFTITEGINIKFTIIRTADFTIRLTSSGSDTIFHQGGSYVAGENIIFGGIGSKLELIYDGTSVYYAISEAGILSSKPAAIRGLVVNLDTTISGSITTSGSNVTNWADQSGESNDVSQGTDANRPTVTSDIFGSGLDGVTFNGTDQWLENTSFTDVTGNYFTTISVFRITSLSDTRTLVWIGDASSGSNYFGHWVTTSGGAIIAASDSSHSRSAGHNGTQVTVAINTNTISAAYERAERTRRVYINSGAQGENISGSATPTGIDKLAVGRFDGTSPSAYLAGHLGQVLVWNRSLRDDELEFVHLHLGDKWGVTLNG